MKHDYFQEEKLKYEEIEIPDELLLMVRQTVAADRRKKTAAWRNRMIKMAGSVAAILLLCLTENADRVEWTYPEGQEERRFGCDREQAAKRIGVKEPGDIGRFAESESNVQHHKNNV